MGSARQRGSWVALWTFAALGLTPLGTLRADAGDPGKAEALFARGKERLAAGDYAEACPLLAESQRLDPATGSLLALALCHEREGKLASACAEYNEVVARSRAEGRPDREQAARDKAATLQTKVSTLTIAGASLREAPELEVRLDGDLLASDQLNRPLPLDGGIKLVEVLAEGRQPFRAHVTLGDTRDAVTLTIPALEPLAAAVAVPTPSDIHAGFLFVAPRPARPVTLARRKDERTRPSSGEWTGMGLLAGGAVGTTLAIGFAARAIHKRNAARLGCMGDVCTAEGQSDRDASARAADGATVSILVGLGMSTAGVITYLLGRHYGRQSARWSGRTTASAWGAPGAAGAALQGRF